MDIKSSFSVKENKRGYRDAIVTVISMFLALKLSDYLYPGDVAAIIFSILPTIFVFFTFTGETKRQQLFFMLEHNVYILLIVALTTIILVKVKHYEFVYIVMLIFWGCILPRFRPGTIALTAYLAIYPVISVLLHNMHLFNESNYWTYLAHISVMYTITVAMMIILILVLPLVKVAVISNTKDNYHVIRALRVSIAVLLALTLSEIFHADNIAWVAIAAIVVMRYSLGESIVRSIERFVGTALGVVCGLLLAHYISSILDVFSFAGLILVFLGMLFVQRSYTMGLFFFTVLLAAVFYFTKQDNLSIYDYLFARLIDTIIGVSIGIGCEALILPRSYLIEIRTNLCLIYRDIWCLIMSWKLSADSTDSECFIKDMQKSLSDVKAHSLAVRYEPMVFLKRRYKYFKSTLDLLDDLTAYLSQQNAKPPFAQATLQLAQDVFYVMRNIYFSDEQVSVKQLTAYVEQIEILQKTVSSSDKALLDYIQKLLTIYLTMLSIKSWRLR